MKLLVKEQLQRTTEAVAYAASRIGYDGWGTFDDFSARRRPILMGAGLSDVGKSFSGGVFFPWEIDAHELPQRIPVES